MAYVFPFDDRRSLEHRLPRLGIGVADDFCAADHSSPSLHLQVVAPLLKRHGSGYIAYGDLKKWIE